MRDLGPLAGGPVWKALIQRIGWAVLGSNQ
jgi:hypothetical protein